MRFFHLGDLHFGKVVHKVPMVDRDQPFWVERFLEAVDEYKPQAVLMAGDIYDRRVPSQEAVDLLNYMVTELAERDIAVLIISGNHDSGVRLSFGEKIFQRQGVHIAGKVQKEMKKVVLKDEYGPINFWLMPYVYPKLVADESVLGCELEGYDQAVRALLGAQKIDENERNVILIHQNVLSNGEKPVHSDSETIVGGLGEVESDAFDAFDYVAMGHIHNAQAMGREEVRYAGCPLFYDFSEEERWKGITMVDVGEKGAVKISKIEVPLLHRMKRFENHLDEVLEEGRQLENKEDYYIQAILTDAHLVAHAREMLTEVFGSSLMNIARKPENVDKSGVKKVGKLQSQDMSIMTLFDQFYQEQENELLDGAQEKIIEAILEQQSRKGGTYYTKREYVPVQDTEDMIGLLLEMEEV